MEEFRGGSPSGRQSERVAKIRRSPMCHLGTDGIDDDESHH